MSEWWTYHLSDFLLFSPRTYDRLIALYNAAVWPAQLLGLALGLLCAAFAAGRVRTRHGSRVALGVLAAAWLFVAIAFLAKRYATINWSASYSAWAFGVEAALLAGFAIAGRIRAGPPSNAAQRAGLLVIVFAVAVEPLISPLSGQGWLRAEVFGVLPDPTAMATLGLLAGARFRGRWSLFPVPVLWCALSGLTLLALKSRSWWIPPLAAAVSAAAAFRTRSAAE